MKLVPNGSPHPQIQVETFRLIIDMGADGSVSVNGPIMNKVLCLGMLQAAIQAVQEFKVNPVTTG